MDFSYEQMKSQRVDLGSYRRESEPQHLHANVVVIDYSPDGRWKNAYQFHHDRDYSDAELAAIAAHIHTLPHDAFLILGEVKEINKQSKTVMLQNGDLVYYRHLITVPHSEGGAETPYAREKQFHAALQSLTYALRIDSKFSPKELLALLAVKAGAEKTKFYATEETLLPLSVPQLLKTFPQARTTPSTFGKRLFELQI